MRRILLCLFVFFITVMVLYADPRIELVHAFAYDNNTPFSFFESWGAGEGETYGGPHFVGFASENLLVVGNEFTIGIEIYNLITGKKENSLNTGALKFGSFVQSVLIGGVGSSSRLFGINKPISNSSQWHLLFDAPAGFGAPDTSQYQTANMLFVGGSNNIHSLEFKPDGSYVYRQPAETLTWLKNNGSALGFEYRVKNNGRIYLGENSVVFSTVYIQLIELGRQWEWPADGSLDVIKNKPVLQPLGVDKKGIGYAYVNNRLGKDWYSADQTLWSPFRTVLIFDPWTMKITYRNIPQTAYQILRVPLVYDGVTSYTVGGRYEMQAHPSGDIYMFSANKEGRAYNLNRMKNDWWAELGADTKVIGRILGNHIPLRSEPNASASIIAYNYENEYVWIQEESKTTTEYEGQKTVWVKVQKLSGALGWMPRLPIILPE